MKDLYKLTVKEASEKIQAGEISSEELTKSCLERVKEMEPEINAFITVTEKYALTRAKEIDKKLSKKELRSPLVGIPYSLKDVYVTKGIETTAGSRILKGYIPQYDATVHRRIEEAGGILIGKTNCDPFGFGSSTEHSGYGVTKNPNNTDYVPGGSSGGSGAAVAYGGGLYSIAEDTGGSIRCPASFCGVDGLKVTYGRVSRYGALAYASSYDTVGPIAQNAEDIALIMSVIAGKDPFDATSFEGGKDDPPDYSRNLGKSLKGRKIGLPKEYYGKGLDDEVRNVIEKAIDKYKSLGCETVEISLPYTEFAIAAYYVVGISEASSNLARYDGIRYGIDVEAEGWKEKMQEVRSRGFSDEAKRRIMVGTYALSKGYADKYYKKAQKVRQLLRNDFERALNEVDIILTPTMPVLPFKIGENIDDPLKMWLVDAFTAAINPVGVPALSVNAGTSKDGLPVGMQLIGPHFLEDRLLNFAHIFEAS
ncbi:Asp-tRNA(Asn)/Glu-tRNA(Gln) amidotransferase subunit GatA [Candidatus Dojkabacteria bacterium]|nr:Asp-tRNA(Asn)/Glu-tRNA(Gln) amidotransferase subunit GatA [Candidatus Dojkabacteria bacterium]